MRITCRGCGVQFGWRSPWQLPRRTGHMCYPRYPRRRRTETDADFDGRVREHEAECRGVRKTLWRDLHLHRECLSLENAIDANRSLLVDPDLEVPLLCTSCCHDLACFILRKRPSMGLEAGARTREQHQVLVMLWLARRLERNAREGRPDGSDPSKIPARVLGPSGDGQGGASVEIPAAPSTTRQEYETMSSAYAVQSQKSGQTYYLHTREVELRGGRRQRIFFFAREVKEGAVAELPLGYQVMENSRTGLPMLKKAS